MPDSTWPEFSKLHLARFLDFSVTMGSGYDRWQLGPTMNALWHPLRHVGRAHYPLFFHHFVAYLHKRHLQMLGQIRTGHAWMETPPTSICVGCNCVWGLLWDRLIYAWEPGIQPRKLGPICFALHIWEIYEGGKARAGPISKPRRIIQLERN